MNAHRDVYIVLKKSLKWVPIVGWVCEKPISFLCSLTPVTGRHSASKIIIMRTPKTERSECELYTGHAILQLYLFGAFVGVR